MLYCRINVDEFCVDVNIIPANVPPDAVSSLKTVDFYFLKSQRIRIFGLIYYKCKGTHINSKLLFFLI